MKKQYFKFSDGADMSNVVMTLRDCMDTIEVDMESVTEDDDRQYIMTPIWLTDEEYKNLPEASI